MKLDEYVGNNPTNATDPSGLEIAGPHYDPYGIAPPGPPRTPLLGFVVQENCFFGQGKNSYTVKGWRLDEDETVSVQWPSGDDGTNDGEGSVKVYLWNSAPGLYRFTYSLGLQLSAHNTSHNSYASVLAVAGGFADILHQDCENDVGIDDESDFPFIYGPKSVQRSNVPVWLGANIPDPAQDEQARVMNAWLDMLCVSTPGFGDAIHGFGNRIRAHVVIAISSYTDPKGVVHNAPLK
jgi:hypothetical protein